MGSLEPYRGGPVVTEIAAFFLIGEAAALKFGGALAAEVLARIDEARGAP